MVKVNKISRLWKRTDNNDLTGLVPEFADMVEIKRYVPYLREFKFNKSSSMVGDYKSSFKGRGMEFEEVRSYTFGDDIRDIDWRVTARKNQPYTKLYAEEKDRQLYVWLDLSTSMRFGTKKELKSVTAAKTAALLGWYALSNRDRFGLMVFDGNKTHIFESKRSHESLLIVLKKIEKIAQETLNIKSESQDKAKSLQLAAKRIGKNSIVFLISDFNFSEDKLKHELTALSAVNEVCLISLYDNLEAVSPPIGEYMAQYEGKQQLLVSYGEDYNLKYEKYFADKRQSLKDFCAKLNCKYRQVRTDLPIYEQLRPI